MATQSKRVTEGKAEHSRLTEKVSASLIESPMPQFIPKVILRRFQSILIGIKMDGGGNLTQSVWRVFKGN